MCSCCAEKDQHDVTVETHPRPVEASVQSAAAKEDIYIDTEGSIASLQSALRTYQARKQSRTNDSSYLDPDDFALSNTAAEETMSDFIGNPEELLISRVRDMLHTLPPFLYSRELKGAKVRSAVRLRDGSVYVGEWVQSWRFGKGKLYSVSGDFREGYWKAGMLHYKGRMVLGNGDVYEGEVAQGKREGRGKLTSQESGSEYEGQWKGDRKEGIGVERFENGSRYTGSFVRGAKQGRGVFEWSDGSRYEGDFFNDVLEGEGKYTWADHRQYDGQWSNNQMHGQGRFTWPDGRVYEGHYERDKKEGFGTYKWEGGKEYEGDWHDGKMHGEGCLRLPGKQKKKYSFVNGKRGNPLEETL